MKREEMLDHIHDELMEFLTNYNNASAKAKPYKIKMAADGLLAIIEGLGMEPPPVFSEGRKRVNPERPYVNEWED